jgi:hypothetical protein
VIINIYNREDAPVLPDTPPVKDANVGPIKVEHRDNKTEVTAPVNVIDINGEPIKDVPVDIVISYPDGVEYTHIITDEEGNATINYTLAGELAVADLSILAYNVLGHFWQMDITDEQFDQQQVPEDNAAGSTRTRTRRGTCGLEAEFALRIMPPRPTGNEEDLLFTLLDKGIRIDGNGHLLMKVKDVRVSPYPGTITFVFRRVGPSGETEFGRISRHLANDADLKRLLSKPPVGPDPPRMNKPDGLAHDNTPITERLIAEVHYDPDDETIDDCIPLRSELTVTWRYNAAPLNFDMELLNADRKGKLKTRIKIPRHRSRVAINGDIIDETTGMDGETNKANHTLIYFKVDDPFGCCGQSNKHYTVIQFVKHKWKFKSEKVGHEDAWNLDGSESQAERHNRKQDYDPTFTTDPSHGTTTANEDNELVHVGPWDATQGSSVIVDDFPGLLESDHELFSKQGGLFQWEFLTLLVCKEDTGSAKHYLKNGKVRAMTHFKLRRNYPGNNKPPTVHYGKIEKPKGTKGGRTPEGGPDYYDPCKDLSEVLRETGLLNAFNNPRPHRIRFR